MKILRTKRICNMRVLLQNVTAEENKLNSIQSLGRDI